MTQQEFFKRYQYNRQNDHLGGGGFGTVYKAYDSYKSEYVALKISEVKKGQESLSLLKEVALSKKLPIHPNIVHYIDCQRYDLPSGLFDFGILKYYPKGNLSQLIQREALNQTQKEAIAKGIIIGLGYLHENDIVHRDLKSSNILMAQHPNGHYIPKIADFGLSKQITNANNSYFSNSFGGGSLLYAAPEQLKAGKIRKNVDLWSLGVVLYELFLGKVPFFPDADIASETGRVELVKKINSGAIPDEIKIIPQQWRQLIKNCLIPNAKERIKSIGQVKQIIGGSLDQKDSLIEKIQKENTELIDTTEVFTKEVKQPSKYSEFQVYSFILGISLLLFIAGKFISPNKVLEKPIAEKKEVPIEEKKVDRSDKAVPNKSDNKKRSSSDSKSKPIYKVEFLETRYDAGNIDKKDECGHAFIFKNIGNAPVKIESVYSKEKNTTYSRNYIEPNDFGEIKIKCSPSHKYNTMGNSKYFIIDVRFKEAVKRWKLVYEATVYERLFRLKNLNGTMTMRVLINPESSTKSGLAIPAMYSTITLNKGASFTILGKKTVNKVRYLRVKEVNTAKEFLIKPNDFLEQIAKYSQYPAVEL